jgi:hypothetical protein
METGYSATLDLMKQICNSDSYKYWLGDDEGAIRTTHISELLELDLISKRMNLRFYKEKIRRRNGTPDVTLHSQAVTSAERCGVTVISLRIFEVLDSNIGRGPDTVVTHLCFFQLLHIKNGIIL